MSNKYIICAYKGIEYINHKNNIENAIEVLENKLFDVFEKHKLSNKLSNNLLKSISEMNSLEITYPQNKIINYDSFFKESKYFCNSVKNEKFGCMGGTTLSSFKCFTKKVNKNRSRRKNKKTHR